MACNLERREWMCTSTSMPISRSAEQAPRGHTALFPLRGGIFVSARNQAMRDTRLESASFTSVLIPSNDSEANHSICQPTLRPPC